MSEAPRSESLERLGRELSERLRAVRPTRAMNYVANFTELQHLLEPIEEVSSRFEASHDGSRRTTIELLEHALEENPELWFAHLVLAFYDATENEDYRAGGERLAAAARMPRAPAYVANLARRMLERAGVEVETELHFRSAAEEPEEPDRELTERERERRLRLAAERQRFMRRIGTFLLEDFEAPRSPSPPPPAEGPSCDVPATGDSP